MMTLEASTVRIAALFFCFVLADNANAYWIDKRVTIQPIVMRSTDGSIAANPQQNIFEAETDKIWAQAGIDFQFLPIIYYNNSLYTNVSSDISQPNSVYSLALDPGHQQSSDPHVVNVWFVMTINGSSSASGFSLQSTTNYYGMLIERNGVSIANSAFAYGGGAGMRDIFAYEVARNLGLNNGNLDASSDVNNLMKLSGPYPTSITNIYPDGVAYCHLTPAQIIRARSASFAVALTADQQYTYVGGTLATIGTLISSANPSLPGQPVAFTFTVNAVAPGQGTPTGTVQFKIDGTNAGAAVSLSGGTARLTNSTLAHGLHTVAAEYAGDANFTGTTNLLSPNELINTPPVAGADTIVRDPASGVRVSIATLLSNDTDADADLISFLGVSAASAYGGTLVSNNGWISYTPSPGFTNTDTFTYTISDGLAAPVTGLVTVNVVVDDGPSVNLTITVLSNGLYVIRGDGIPGRVYRMQYADQPQNTNWQTLGTVTADQFGIFEITDAAGTPQRYYRSIYP